MAPRGQALQPPQPALSRRGRLRSLLVALLLPVAAAAHVGDRVFLAWELPTAELPDLHDETLEDWDEVIPEATLTHQDLEGAPNWTPAPQASQDFAMRVFLAWHDAGQQLYVGLDLVDDLAQRLDLVRVLVDGDHSGGPFDPGVTEPADLEALTQAQYYHAFLRPDDGSGDRLFGGFGPTAWAYLPPWHDGGIFQYGQQPTRSFVELKLTPWDELGADSGSSRRSRLVAGQVIGFQVSFVDDDFGLEATAIGIQANASVFADLELIPCHHLDCSQARTAVAPDSWARIKAGLRR